MNITNTIKLLALSLLISCSMALVASPIQPQTEAEKFEYLASLINKNAMYEMMVQKLPAMMATAGVLFFGWKSSMNLSKKIKDMMGIKQPFLRGLSDGVCCTTSAIGVFITTLAAPILLHTTLGKLFINNASYLKRTLEAFEKHPEFFPTEAHPILQEAKRSLACKDVQQINTSYFQLCYVQRTIQNKKNEEQIRKIEEQQRAEAEARKQNVENNSQFLGFKFLP